MGSKGMGNLLGNDITQFLLYARHALGGGGARYGVWLFRLAVLLRRFAATKKGSIMSVSSPRLVSMAIGEKVDLEELGGWRLHAEQTGLIDQFVDSDEEAMAVIWRFLSYMPSHNGELPPVAPVLEGSGDKQDQILEILPEKRTQVYNMKKIVEVIFDRDSFFEFKPRFGRPAIVGLARLDGKSVGVIANNFRRSVAARCRQTPAVNASISPCCATASTFRWCASWIRQALWSGSKPSVAAHPGTS